MANVINRARAIKERNGDDGINDYIRALLYPSTYLHLFNRLVSADHQAPELQDVIKNLPININSQSLNLYEMDKSQYPINLGKDIVFTTPWNPESIKCIGHIGHKVTFSEDKSNHHILACYPLRLNFVISGNHSIMQGILNGQGVVYASTFCDISEELRRYSYDGNYWINHDTGEEKEVLNHYFGLAWEVSKFLGEPL